MAGDSIQILNPNAIRQLRSTLVISTLASCIEELVQNALDAHASKVDVMIDVDKFSVQVDDNGTGIQNLADIGQRYASSKCHSLQDLHQVQTFGFRGEALYSIISISLTQIISRHYLTLDTFEALWRGNEALSFFKRATRRANSGTTVIVRDLFYQYPVRRRQMNSYQHVTVLENVKRRLIRFGLCFPSVHFTLKEGSRAILVMKKCPSSLDAFKLLMKNNIRGLETWELDQDTIRLDGFFSIQRYPNKEHQYLYVNQHFIPTTSKLYKTVIEEFAPYALKMENREARAAKHLIFLIKIKCDEWSSFELGMYRDMFDEFREYKRIQSVLQAYVHTLIVKMGWKPLREKKKKRVEGPEEKVSSFFVQHSSFDHAQERTTDDRIDTLYLKRQADFARPVPRPPSRRSAYRLGIPQRLSKEDLKAALVLGQVDQKFIALKIDQTVLFMDQHAADERIKLEEMMKNKRIFRKTVLLEPSIPLELTVADYEVMTHATVLRCMKTWGIHVVKANENSQVLQEDQRVILTDSRYFSKANIKRGAYVVRLPQVIVERCLQQPELVQTMIVDYAYWVLEQQYHPSLIHTVCPEGMVALLKSKACRSAIMFNHPLSLEQCESLVQNLSKTDFPFQCAHGRPSIVPIYREAEREKRQKRKIHWENVI
ncbi:histidine kinase-like ATPase [Sporodiniella umbellata]|nr:histidine kinase-like ATPase [Sporodiniella umbellata]